MGVHVSKALGLKRCILRLCNTEGARGAETDTDRQTIRTL